MLMQSLAPRRLPISVTRKRITKSISTETLLPIKCEACCKNGKKASCPILELACRCIGDESLMYFRPVLAVGAVLLKEALMREPAIIMREQINANAKDDWLESRP